MNKIFIYQILPNLLISPAKLKFIDKNNNEIKPIDKNYEVISAKKKKTNGSEIWTFVLNK